MANEELKRNAGPRQIARARAFRKEPSIAEDKLWQALRGRRLDGWKFRRQFPIENYTTDFACLEAALVIEVDGESHDLNAARDEARSRAIEADGFKVIRFANEDVLFRFEGVLRDIVEHCRARSGRMPSP